MMSDEEWYMGAESDQSCIHDWEWLPEPYEDVMKCSCCGMYQR